MINRAKFFAALRKSRIFEGGISQSAVDNIEVILAEYDRRRVAAQGSGRTGWPLAWLAYQLATVRGECGPDMAPVREIGRGRGKRYGRPAGPHGHVYYGRGYVQLTWLENYRIAMIKLQLPLISNPDAVMDPAVAVRILFDGMREGWFAGDRKGRHTLGRYFNDRVTDWNGARRIINGTDKAATFASWGRQFHEALLFASEAAQPETIAPPPPPKPVTRSTTIGAAAGGVVIETLDRAEKAASPAAEAAEKASGLMDLLRPLLDLWAAVPDWLKALALIAAFGWIIRERLLARTRDGR